MHRIVVTTTDGGRFRGPLIEDDEDQEESFDRFTAAVEEGELPDWLGGIGVDDVVSWGVIPGPRYRPRNARPSRKGAVKATVAVWPDPGRGYVATPVGGVAGGNLHAYGETENDALMAAANMLDVLRDRPLEIKSNLPPEVIDGLLTKPEEQPGVKYFRLEIERGNRFHFEPIDQEPAE